MNKEIAIIQRELKIPVTNVTFYPTYVEVLSGDSSIGGIPYYTVSGINTYDTSNKVLFRLKWDQVYLNNQTEINSEIYKLVGRNDVLVTIGTFRRLYVKEIKPDTLICAVSGSYDDMSWKVEKE